jgi:hypothetical protein
MTTPLVNTENRRYYIHIREDFKDRTIKRPSRVSFDWCGLVQYIQSHRIILTPAAIALLLRFLLPCLPFTAGSACGTSTPLTATIVSLAARTITLGAAVAVVAGTVAIAMGK